MSEQQKTLMSELISDLKQQRDELRLKIHLGGQELKDEFGKLDDKLAQLNRRYTPLKNAVGETAGDIWESLNLVGTEIKEGFHRIRKAVQ